LFIFRNIIDFCKDYQISEFNAHIISAQRSQAHTCELTAYPQAHNLASLGCLPWGCMAVWLCLVKCRVEDMFYIKCYTSLWLHIHPLTLERRTSHRGNHLFCHHVNCWLKKFEKALIWSQTTLDDLPFLHKIWRMNSCISVLH